MVSIFSWSQKVDDSNAEKDNFWKNVRFGGGIQLSVGSGFTTVGISPSGIYEFSDKLAAGIGLSYLYSKYKLSDTKYNVFGASALGLYNPIKEFQLSVEIEGLNITEKYFDGSKDSHQLPALYLGAAYAMGRNVAVGIRYDVLYNEDNRNIYDSAFTPFIRVYF